MRSSAMLEANRKWRELPEPAAAQAIARSEAACEPDRGVARVDLRARRDAAAHGRCACEPLPFSTTVHASGSSRSMMTLD